MEQGIILAMLAYAAGGILKGAIGAGTPIVVIPIMSIYFDVPFAVSVFVIPAFLSNVWQIWQYRKDLLPRDFLLPLVIGAMIGAILGSVLLTALPSENLSLIVGILALIYVGFRITKPSWQLAYDKAKRITFPVGIISGILQGAAGISAPISLTFVNAMRLERPAFIATISSLFTSMAFVQIPTLAYLGALDLHRAFLGLAACIPLFLGMPIGEWLARFIKKETFEKFVLALLVIIAVRLIWEGLAG